MTFHQGSLPLAFMESAFKYLSIFLLFAWSNCIPAQETFQCARLGLDEGISDLRIQDICQDSYGYLWFATLDGLNRYDGYNFLIFNKDSNQFSLPSNAIYAVYTDSQNDLWVGTGNGLAKYNYRTQQFTRFDSIPEIGKALIRIIKEDPDGNLYVGGSRGICQLNRKTNRWIVIKNELKSSWDILYVRDLHFVKSNEFYVTTEKKGFYRVDLKFKQVEPIIYEDSNYGCLSDILMYDMEPINEDELLISFLSPGVKLFNKKTQKFRVIPGPLSDSKDVFWNTVPKIYKDHQGRIWISSIHFGLCEYIVRRDTIISYNHSNQLPYGLNTGPVNCVYQDKQQNLWIGTRDYGVLRFNPNRQCVFFFDQHDYQNYKLQTSAVNGIFPWKSDLAIIGVQDGFSVFDYSNRKFTNYKGDAINRSDNYLKGVNCVTEDQQGNLWLGTQGLGMMKWNPGSKKVIGYNRKSFHTMIYPDDFVFQSIGLEDGRIFTMGLGRISLINPKRLVTLNRKTSKEPLHHLTDVQFCYKDTGRNILMIKGSGRVYKYSYESNELVDLGNAIAKLYPGIFIYRIDKDSIGNTWYATNQNLIKMDVDSCFYSFSFLDKLNSTVLTGILAEQDGIWITTNRKIGRLIYQTGQFQVLTESEGYVPKQLNAASLCKLANGKIYIGCKDGIFEISPDKFSKPFIDYQAHLTSFHIIGKSESINCQDTSCQIQLNYKENYFSFQLSAFQFSEAQDLEYEYLLEGFDSKWNTMGKDRMGFYTKVHPGKFTLIFRIRPQGGEWVQSKQKINIEVLPPFWQSKVFFILVFSLVGGLIYWFFNFKLKTIQREERLRSEFEIKIHELENSALRTQMNPHFIFNCLNTINAFVQKNDRANAGLMISKFSKLIRMILNHSREKRISLKEELEALELYIQIESTRFESKFEYQIQLDPDIYPDAIEFPSLIFQPFVENAILHGLLPSNQKGKLVLSIKKEADHLLCIIEDNGIGREASKNLRPNQSHQKSHGLEITLKRVELFNQEHHFSGKVNIVDLINEDPLTTGTRVELPLALSHAF